jgi:hypothetical protein
MLLTAEKPRDRARDSWQRPGSFEPGHKKLGGRKKRTPNRISPSHKKAIREAAHRIGSDGNGKDGGRSREKK